MQKELKQFIVNGYKALFHFSYLQDNDFSKQNIFAQYTAFVEKIEQSLEKWDEIVDKLLLNVQSELPEIQQLNLHFQINSIPTVCHNFFYHIVIDATQI